MSVELLAPAGNLEKAKTAIRYGANAVYIGGQEFSLRSRASNFSIDQIRELCLFAHERNAKVHVTVNIIPHPSDFEGLKAYFKALDEAGIDAIISASPSIIRKAKQGGYGFQVHVSTQRSILNEEAVRFWKKQGADRVVLGRETPIESIAEICSKDIADIEVFIHGGMCISYSGRCVLSNHMTNRDANRGGCAQSCRWKYQLDDESGEISNPDIPFSMSSRDLQSVRHVAGLIQAGAVSLKIEGRMKSDYYLAVVVGAYRRLIDAIESDPYKSVDEAFLQEIAQEIARAENRPTGPGFYEGLPDENVQLYTRHDENVTQEYIGLVEEVLDDSRLKVIVKNHFEDHTPVELFGPSIAPYKTVLDGIEDEEGTPLAVCPHPMQKVILNWTGSAKAGAMIRKQRK